MNNNQDFTTGSISKKMINFMLPILAALILQAMYSAVDLIIVGKFGTTEGISGVTTGSSIMNMITFTICSLTSGVMILMGQYIGEKNQNKIGKLLGGSIVFFIIVGVSLTAILLIFAKNLAILMQAPKEALDLTVTYIKICGGGFIFIVFYNFISCIFRGMGDSKLPLLSVGIACIVNIIGDLVLVAGFKMDVAGAAIATVFAQIISVIISYFIIRKKNLPFSIKKEDFKLNSEVRKFLKVGSPLALQDFLTNLTFLAICAFVNKIGLDASSGYGVAQKIQSFIMLIPSAIMQSMSAFVAQNVGARKEDRAKKAMLFGMAFGGIIGIFIAVLAFFKGDLLSTFFTNDPLVINRSFEFLKGFAVEAVITSILFSFMGYFNGHSKSLFVMVQGLIQSFLIRLPMSYFMSIKPNATLTGIGAAAPTATTIGITLCIIYYLKTNKKTFDK